MAEHPSARHYSPTARIIFATFAAARIDAISTICRRIELRALVLRPPAGDETGTAGNSYF
jgi:hypothetical protein